MRTSSAGIQAKDVIPQFKESPTVSEINPTLNTYYPILNISGSGKFYQGTVSSNDVVTAHVLTLRITLDGVVLLTAPSPSQVGGFSLYLDTITTLKTLAAGELNYTTPFKNSLLAEIKTNLTLVAGKQISGRIKYGEC